MLNIGKIARWGSSRVQKNEIAFKINWKHHKIPNNYQSVRDIAETLQKSCYTLV